MKVLQMPLNKFIGLQKDNDLLTLNLSENVKNHIGSIHAGAQFTLAESASGVYLAKLFPELQDKIIPLLRSSNMKFKKTAFDTLTAYPLATKDVLEKFQKQFLKKGRGSITVEVELKNMGKEIVTIGTFNWFVQKI